MILRSRGVLIDCKQLNSVGKMSDTKQDNTSATVDDDDSQSNTNSELRDMGEDDITRLEQHLAELSR